MTTRKLFDCCFLRIQIYLNMFFAHQHSSIGNVISLLKSLQLNKLEDISLNCWSCTPWKTKMDLKTYQKLAVLRLLTVFFPLSSGGIFQLRPFRIKPLFPGCNPPTQAAFRKGNAGSDALPPGFEETETWLWIVLVFRGCSPFPPLTYHPIKGNQWLISP